MSVKLETYRPQKNIAAAAPGCHPAGNLGRLHSKHCILAEGHDANDNDGGDHAGGVRKGGAVVRVIMLVACWAFETSSERMGDSANPYKSLK